ncbi:MAG: molybdenum cofactor guanylyltransferase [Solirubrobacteraceae bacterium]|jgi:molybdopterin-guanine dinucleotide biosynthesis protein A|nr:molybdenum cofactor guanylyltransferase [Solirubrobacteraceae bacterium]
MDGVVGAVLAGGASRRFGAAKARAQLGGRPLLEYPLAAVRGSGMEAVVVAKPDSDLPPVSVARWDEPADPVHPLCGVVTALERADGRPVVAVGCDMPFVTAELVAWLAAAPERLVVPRAGGRLHPLVARYDVSVLDDLRQALDQRLPLRTAVAALDARAVDEDELRRFGDPDRLTFNVNEPADLAEAERLLQDP